LGLRRTVIVAGSEGYSSHQIGRAGRADHRRL
jgi:hypothetical protein